MNPKKFTARHIINKMAENKGKGRILKATREATSYIQRNSHKVMSCLFSTNFAGQKGVAWYIQSAERKKTYNQEYLARLSFRIEGEIKSFTDKQR